MVPNEELILTRVTSWTYSSTRARAEIALTVEYGSDALRVQEILLLAAKECTRLIADPAPACFLGQIHFERAADSCRFGLPSIHEGSPGKAGDATILKRLHRRRCPLCLYKLCA